MRNIALILFSVAAFVCQTPAALADSILVADNNFNKYLSTARAGDVFTVFPGKYLITTAAKLNANGTISKPIILRPSKPGTVKIFVNGTTGFNIGGKYWIVEGFDIQGICKEDRDCEHAFHISGDADNTIIRNNTLIDFNAAIKGNGGGTAANRKFPDRVLIENNSIYNKTIRNTRRSVTPIDVVGGKYWRIRNNFIADFAKSNGNKVSYGAFLKGNSASGLFDRNLIICEWRHKGGIRLGLSFGGGGTGEQYCEGGSCPTEHSRGVIRSNIILNCPADVGIYLNKSANTKLINNTILNTAGVDVRFSTSSANFAGNIIEGRIKNRDGGTHHSYGDLIEDDLNELFPNAETFDLSATNLEKLKYLPTKYVGLDYCTGKKQTHWYGALAQSPTCDIRTFLKKVIEKEKQDNAVFTR